MRAQSAMVETLAAVAILAIAMSFAAREFYLSSLQSPMSQVSLANAQYDFWSIMSGNSSARQCVDMGGGQCLDGLLGGLVAASGASYASFSSPFANSSYGSMVRCTVSSYECLPYEANSAYSSACLYICGG